jgi:hypothetical protein
MIELKRRGRRIAAPAPKWGHSSQNRFTNRAVLLDLLFLVVLPSRGDTGKSLAQAPGLVRATSVL